MAKSKYVFMIETPKTEHKVKEFLEAFKKLAGEEKIYFLAQIDKVLAGKNEKDKKIFLTLIKAARESRSLEEAIQEMKKV
jgi:DNA polymerase III delta prime subunit